MCRKVALKLLAEPAPATCTAMTTESMFLPDVTSPVKTLRSLQWQGRPFYPMHGTGTQFTRVARMLAQELCG
jgi:hypothetical protein